MLATVQTSNNPGATHIRMVVPFLPTTYFVLLAAYLWTRPTRKAAV